MSSDAALSEAAPRFPQEIIEIIINHCHSDKGTLSILANVSWSWLHSARSHLFARVELHELYRLSATADRPVPFDPFWRFQFGLEIMRSSPAIASYVRFVQIRAKSDRQHMLVTQGFQFLSLLPNLHTLSLVDVYWPGLTLEDIPTIQRGISTVAPTLQELSLTTVTFVNPADLALFIRAFPKVKRVSFSNCIFTWRDPDALTMASVLGGFPEPRVQTLVYVSIHNCPSQAILEMLLQCNTFELNLEGVKIYWDEERLTDFPTYKEFFRVVGNSLRTIELGVRLSDFQQHNPDDIIQLLSECRQLSSFSINTSYRSRDMFSVWFEPIIKIVATPTLEELNIHCNLYSTRGWNLYIPWFKVDGMLSDVARVPLFRRLNVVIHCIDTEDVKLLVEHGRKEAVHSILRELMPRLLQADMLRIREPEVDTI
ncbi:hypothetical protein CPB85DRAFT_1318020 [Mucidula mucida]|nr:hypothetical protein CPB85DRAFT_1318020 [Mucidula mucida]